MPGAFIDGMALGALGLEDLLSSLVIARRCFAEGRHFRPSLSFRLSSAEALIRVCEEAPVRSATEQLLRARPPATWRHAINYYLRKLHCEGFCCKSESNSSFSKFLSTKILIKSDIVPFFLFFKNKFYEKGKLINQKLLSSHNFILFIEIVILHWDVVKWVQRRLHCIS